MKKEDYPLLFDTMNRQSDVVYIDPNHGDTLWVLKKYPSNSNLPSLAWNWAIFNEDPGAIYWRPQAEFMPWWEGQKRLSEIEDHHRFMMELEETQEEKP